MIPTRIAGDSGQGGMQTLVRALRILRELADQGGGLTLQDLSSRLDIPLASTYRLLTTMAAEGFIYRSPRTKRCFVGPSAQALGEAWRRDVRLLHLPPPALAQVAVVSGETAFITELIDDKAVCVSIAEGRRPLRTFARLGREMPLHAAASARVLLVDHDDRQLRSMLGAWPLEAYAPRTPCSYDDVAERVRRVRDRGYDICEEELDEGVLAVSVPVCDEGGQVRQSVTIAAPHFRMRRPATWELTIRVLREAAAALASELQPRHGDRHPAAECDSVDRHLTGGASADVAVDLWVPGLGHRP